MEDCVSAIIRLDSAAPEPVTRHIRTRGVARRPTIGRYIYFACIENAFFYFS